jgi:hypothetical protein
VDINGAAVAVVVEAPDLVEQLVAGEDPVEFAGQLEEQLPSLSARRRPSYQSRVACSWCRFTLSLSNCTLRYLWWSCGFSCSQGLSDNLLYHILKKDTMPEA